MSTVVLSHSDCKDLRSAARHSTVCLRYSFPSATIASIQEDVRKLGGIRNLGLHIQTKDKKLSICAQVKANVDKTSLRVDSSPIKRFFKWLFAERMADGSFVDFFLSYPLPADNSAAEITPLLQKLTKKKISIRFVNRFLSPDLPPHNRRIVDLYFEGIRLSRMKTAKAASANAATRSTPPTTSHSLLSSQDKQYAATAGYERIRVVGKGAFGAAILYRRLDDDSLVIIKEINMHDLAAPERQLALNEVNLLSRLDHPHIVSYFDSFEEDGILMIEMEFADGGTLAQHLSRSESFLPEQEVQELMRQMLSAVSYLHRNSVLHRDLKTANVFLTREGAVKIGDFGISRIMGTDTIHKGGAETVVGTPYYISPEMCEGKSYNDKSDVWALGCILYEMACLQKAFEGENLPALVNKIMRCEYEPVRGPYTSDLKMLIRDMLQLAPNQRPSAEKALEIVEKMGGCSTRKKTTSFFNVTSSPSANSGNVRSVVYNFDVATTSMSPVVGIPSRIRVSQVVLGPSHSVLIAAAEQTVYAWGSNEHGQLGMGDRVQRDQPTRVRSLDGKNVKKAALGAMFSVFLADRGTLLVCGDRKMSGNGKETVDQLEPQLVTSILRMDIVDVACGDEHVVAVAGDGGVYVWGSGQNGRLGTGNMESLFIAARLPLPARPRMIAVRCGPDATALITDEGNMLCMGSNRHNKLNLAHRHGFFAKEQTGSSESVLVPTAVKPFPARIVGVSLGKNHSGVVLESGLMYLFGLNTHGELGLGVFQSVPIGWHIPVKSLLNRACVTLACGDGFSLAGTAESELFFWGSKGSIPSQAPLTVEELDITTTPYSQSRVVQQKAALGSSIGTKTLRWAMKRRSDTETVGDVIEQIVPHPSLVLRLDSSADCGQTIRISSIVCNGRRVLVTIDTTVAMKLNQIAKKALRIKRQHSAPDLREETMVSTRGGEVQTWLKREFNNAEKIPMPSYIARSQANLHMSNSDSKRLMTEIETLRKQLQEQSSRSQSHSTQMTLLQTKLAELQARQAHLRKNEPPPAYVVTTQSPHKVVHNNFFPDQQTLPTTSRACSIL